MTVVRLEAQRIHQRRADGSMEILSPRSKTIKLNLVSELNSSPLDLLRAAWESDKLSPELRIQAAGMAMPYVYPRLAMVLPANCPSQITIVGGMPKLPGSATIFPEELRAERTLASRRSEAPPEPTAPCDASPCEPQSSFDPIDEPSGF
jgi:hypothetical protein